MPGDGTKPDITTADPHPGRLLDLTRLIRRAGRVFTGVDRVEFAYLRALLAQDVPCWALVRTSAGYLLLDRTGMSEIAAKLAGEEPWQVLDLMSRLSKGAARTRRCAVSNARAVSIGRCIPRGLQGLLHRYLPAGCSYLNTGHSNLTDRVLTAAASLGGRTAVFVHDVIPLEYPEYQREGSVAPFEDKMRRVQAFADLIICNSADTLARAQGVMREWGTPPEGIVSHLGTDLSVPVASEIPDGLIANAPYFVCVGTIEPRKNHALLLDIWEQLGDAAPTLLICGGRGWNNAEVFARLDAQPRGVVECTGLTDGAIAALIEGSNGLLFPSFAEGFGLPPVEALALGVPVVCSDLPVLKETLGNKPIYAAPDDRYLWIKAIEKLSIGREPAELDAKFEPPTWSEHFNAVLMNI